MNCPNCKAVMERDDYGNVRTTNLIGEIIYDPPEAWYVCDECGLEATWIANKAGLNIIYDPRKNPLDVSWEAFYEGYTGQV